MSRGSKLNSFLFVLTRCGTVMDFVVAMMLDLSQPVTSVQVRRKNIQGYDLFMTEKIIGSAA